MDRRLRGIRYDGATNIFKVTCNLAANVNFRDPELLRLTTWLQLRDLALGQADRHGGNYFVQTAPPAHNTVVRLTSVDEDQSDGDNDDPEALAVVRDPHARSCLYPPIVDEEMKAAFDRIDVDHLDAMEYALTPEEAGARGLPLGTRLAWGMVASPANLAHAKERIRRIKDYLNGFAVVIPPAEWARYVGDGSLSAENSYMARDRDKWATDEFFQQPIT